LLKSPGFLEFSEEWRMSKKSTTDFEKIIIGAIIAYTKKE